MLKSSLCSNRFAIAFRTQEVCSSDVASPTPVSRCVKPRRRLVFKLNSNRHCSTCRHRRKTANAVEATLLHSGVKLQRDVCTSPSPNARYKRRRASVMTDTWVSACLELRMCDVCRWLPSVKLRDPDGEGASMRMFGRTCIVRTYVIAEQVIVAADPYSLVRPDSEYPDVGVPPAASLPCTYNWS
ncbi:hypothetical protein EXIGLDRAFT_4106 [Exidia glandulosa HHB12029]|uniref:Uncharacterized protein n=1 Tax=Exidia glandulosa HHB12029 TaxID=1314781 RepID=A0A166BT48_EXIGL|nr:hypothetical protein EXIGLDRAFT_4106 [Exidia glandulosa HHB12029]